MLTFGELLIKYTERAGISDAELARTTGVQRQTIFRWKEGLVARPRYREDVLRIAARLRLTPEERDELLLAAGFPPESPAGSASPGTPSGAVAVGLSPEPANAALREEILAESTTASSPDTAAIGACRSAARWRRCSTTLAPKKMALGRRGRQRPAPCDCRHGAAATHLPACAARHADAGASDPECAGSHGNDRADADSNTHRGQGG